MDAISDGNYTLEDTLSAIRYRESIAFVLTALSPGAEEAHFGDSTGPVNYASLASVLTVPNELDLVSVADPQALGGLISSRQAGGWTLIWCLAFLWKGIS